MVLVSNIIGNYSHYFYPLKVLNLFLEKNLRFTLYENVHYRNGTYSNAKYSAENRNM